MSIEQLDLLLCDTYQMDAWFPLGWKWKKELEKSSYSVWAIDELKRYIVGRLYPKKSGSVEDFIICTINRAKFAAIRFTVPFVDFLSTVLTEEFAKRFHFLFIHHQILLFFQAGFCRTAWIPTNSSYLPRSIGRNCCSRMKKYRRTAITRYSTRST